VHRPPRPVHVLSLFPQMSAQLALHSVHPRSLTHCLLQQAFPARLVPVLQDTTLPSLWNLSLQQHLLCSSSPKHPLPESVSLLTQHRGGTQERSPGRRGGGMGILAGTETHPHRPVSKGPCEVRGTNLQSSLWGPWPDTKSSTGPWNRKSFFFLSIFCLPHVLRL
jgi:hypothetical protein